ncbi:MAG: non-homologous end-joining DNA ligase, partial [Cyclobacteriaceae bacterium]
IELSNLEKVMYPEQGIFKAEIIQYYLQVAPTILRHIKGRPLSLIRFPEGITGDRFFQKNKPQWAPQWIESVKLGSDDKKDYIMATEEASLVWLANLACLELHQMHFHNPNYSKPDYFVFDLDPPEGYDFKQVIEIAFLVKEALEEKGYYPFVKTSGGKGLHLYAPVEPNWTSDQVFEAAKNIAQPLAERHNKIMTLNIKKDARKGRVLLDIYRNRSSQTIIAAYSLRGISGAPVSMPVTWDLLSDMESPKIFTYEKVLPYLMDHGDAWETMAAYAVPLHTQQKTSAVKRELPTSDKRKSPEQLDRYMQKRDFNRTPEPKDPAMQAKGNAYVIHRHHASRLHYDLRLEHEGVLRSWAVPKGMPPRPGVKRLIVQTEDHPLEYLSFKGTIPKGEYGAGPMWIYNTGKYEIIKQKKNGFYFNLYSQNFQAEYRMHNTKEQEWLLERVDQPQVDWLQKPLAPMLAVSNLHVPQGNDFIYELKWDGIRAIISVDEGELTIWSRNGQNITNQFPELQIPEKAFRTVSAVFDGEIVCFDPEGKPSFSRIITRLKQTGKTNIERKTASCPAFCYLFDCLFLDGRPLVNDPLWQRREWLADSLKKDTPFRLSEHVEDGQALLEATKNMGLEGIIVKDINSRYQIGKRSTAWCKIKNRNTADCLIIGYTQGKGEREDYFGALQLAQESDGKLIYRGKVGTGFNQQKMRDLVSVFKNYITKKKPLPEKMEDEKVTTWLKPVLVGEIEFASITDNNTFREPVFLHLREDLAPVS